MIENYTLLIIEDDQVIRKALKKYLEMYKFKVSIAVDGKSAKKLLEKEIFNVVVSDWNLPDCKGDELISLFFKKNPNTVFILMTGYADIQVAVNSVKRGAFYYITKPFSFDKLLEIIKTGIFEKILYFDNTKPPPFSLDVPDECRIIGNSAAIQNVINLIHMVKNHNTTVLIMGETGTGKELVAKAIHYSSRRRNKPILNINCGAIPNELLEDELFGHIKGAYTGATSDRKGYFEQANGGTLFLDEIGTMNHAVQQKLLRVLQDHTITPVGSTVQKKIDVRIIAATNADLSNMVQKGEFREDLYYRLNVFPIKIPPLRERKSDIPLLVNFFVSELCAQHGMPVKKLDPECLKKLTLYSWPGNIRQLRNAVEYSFIVSGNEQTIKFEHFNLPGFENDYKKNIKQPKSVAEVIPDIEDGVDFSSVVHEIEKKLLIEGLKKAGGNKQKAARLLKMKRTTLVEKMKRLKLDTSEILEE